MRPENAAYRVLSITRSKAKMFEYDVPPEHHIDMRVQPETLFSLAVGLLGDASAEIARDAVEVVNATPEQLTFSGTFFDAYVKGRLSAAIDTEFPTLAGASYFLADNPGSAKVLTSQAPPPPGSLGLGLALLNHRLLSGDYAALDAGGYGQMANVLLSAFASYMQGEGTREAVISAANTIRFTAYETGDGREVLYADVVSAIVRKKLDGAAATVLPPASGLPLDTWRPYFARPGFPKELWPSQQRICGADVLQGRSALIQMPTSAGKTRATELIIRSGFLSGRVTLAVIVCPFRSLCHDIRSDMARAFAGDGIALNEATDSFQLDLDLGTLIAQRCILIVTPEKLLYLLRQTPELAARIGLVIYDEGHQFDSGARGVTYELLLTSLKLLLAPETQVVLISAVIANGAKIAEWLIDDGSALVEGGGLLPTVRSVAFASWQDELGRMEFVNPLDPDDGEFFVPRVIKQLVFPPATPGDDEAYFPSPEDGASVGLHLGLKLCPQGSVAVFCGTKDAAAKLCGTAAWLFEHTSAYDAPSARSDAAELAKLVALIAGHLGVAANATKAGRLGIFAHHASVPHGLRLAIEHSMKAGLITFVVCTSTLAQGVNLPIRYLVVTGVQQGADRILVRDFHNLIGRAGRAGMHTEGTIIFADTKVFDNKLVRREKWRWAVAKDLLDPSNAEPSASSIADIFEPFRFGRRPVRTIQMPVERFDEFVLNDEATVDQLVQQLRLANQYINERELRRFLKERVRVVHGIASFLLTHLDFASDDVPGAAVTIAENTLGHFLADDAQGERISELFRKIAIRLQDVAFDEALRLAVRRSPLPPRHVRDLRAFLDDNRATLLLARAGGTLLAAIEPTLRELNQSSTVTGLSDRTVMSSITDAWVGGHSFETIHGSLRAADIRTGGRRRRMTLEDTVALCEGGLGYEGAMVVATLADLAAGIGDGLSDGLAIIQRQLKCGLTTLAGLAFFEAGFADRIVATALATAYPLVTDRYSAISALRAAPLAAQTAIATYPDYYRAVLDEQLA